MPHRDLRLLYYGYSFFKSLFFGLAYGELSEAFAGTHENGTWELRTKCKGVGKDRRGDAKTHGSDLRHSERLLRREPPIEKLPPLKQQQQQLTRNPDWKWSRERSASFLPWNEWGKRG